MFSSILFKFHRLIFSRLYYQWYGIWQPAFARCGEYIMVYIHGGSTLVGISVYFGHMDCIHSCAKLAGATPARSGCYSTVNKVEQLNVLLK